MPVTAKLEDKRATWAPEPNRENEHLPAEGYVDNFVLAAGVAETVTVPAGARVVYFSTTADFWVRFSNDSPLPAAAVPSADVTDGTGSVFNPRSRDVTSFSQFSIISDYAAKLSLSWYL